MRGKQILLVATLAAVIASVPAGAQDVDALTKQANLELARMNVEKARAEAQKAQIDVANNRLAPLKGQTGDTATVSTGEKTVEALLLNREVMGGLSFRLVEQLCKRVTGCAAETLGQAFSNIKPVIIFGSTPPDLSFWYAFQADRAVVWRDLVLSMEIWGKAEEEYKAENDRKSFGIFSFSGVVAAVGVVLPLLKTDTTIVGATWTPTGVAVISAVERALAAKGFGVDDSAYRVTSGVETAKQLMGASSYFPDNLTAKYEDARTLARGKNLWNIASDPKSDAKLKNAAQRVVNAIAAYEALLKNLTTVTLGTMNATTIERMRQLERDLPTRPLLYIVNVEAAFTTTTKKGLFTGFGTVPAYIASGIVVDYVIVNGDQPAVRGSVRCVISKKKMEDVFALNGKTVCQ